MEKIEIDKAIYDFLNGALFGSSNVTFIAATKRAYRDMCRTLRLNGKDSKSLSVQVGELLEKSIVTLLERQSCSQDEYDIWHKQLCDAIISCGAENDIPLTVGQAQKWLNMTMKYLYIQSEPNIEKVFGLCHVPIDSYIIAAAYEELGIKRPSKAWSKIDDYSEYLEYQKEIRKRLKQSPMEWEFDAWQRIADADNEI